jgi:hypothetical protein
VAELRAVDELQLVALVLRGRVGVVLEGRERLLDLTERVADPARVPPGLLLDEQLEAARGCAAVVEGLARGAGVIARPQPRRERREILELLV